MTKTVSVKANTKANTKAKAETVTALMTEKLIMTEVSDVEAAIVKAHKTTKDVQLQYQRIAVSVIAILEKHRNIAVVRNLFKSMTVDLPESMRVDSMQAFFMLYAPVTFDPKTQEAKFDKKGSFNIADAMRNAWWLAKPRQFLKPFNLQAEIQALYEKAVKRRDNPKQDEASGVYIIDAIDIADLNALKKLIKGGNTSAPVTAAKEAPVAAKSKQKAA